MFRHVVSFKLADDKKDMIDEAKKRLLSLSAIEQVKFVQVGVDIFKSERSYDILLIMDFLNLDTFKEYEEHELHIPVRDYIHGIISEAVSVDYFVD